MKVESIVEYNIEHTIAITAALELYLNEVHDVHEVKRLKQIGVNRRRNQQGE